MKSHNTIVQMMTSITDPVIIERCYQIFAAKRELLARNAKTTREFAHSYMEPRPLDDVKCPDMVELSRVKAESAIPEPLACVSGQYKLAPSLSDTLFVRGLNGSFMLELHGSTQDMNDCNIWDGDLFTMESVGDESSTVRSVKYTTRTARIHNRHLRVVFVSASGSRYSFPN